MAAGRPGEAGVASAAHSGTKSMQSAEGDLLGLPPPPPWGPTFKQMSAGSKRSGRKTLV